MITVRISSSSLINLKKESSKYFFRETGGILLGRWVNSKEVFISHVSGPGIKAKHGFGSFEIDHKYTQKFLDSVFEKNNGKISYLGDWHTHPCKPLILSELDKKTLEAIAKDSGFLCPKPLSLLLKRGYTLKIDNLDLKCFIFENNKYKKISNILFN